MIRLSRKTLLALEAVIDIAYNARPEPVQAKEITARQGVPQRYLEQVMQQLVRAGILKGVRGPRGGYRLARERRRISVGDVVRIAMSLDDAEESFDGGSELGRRVVVPLIASLQEDVMKRLDEISIEDVCKRARATGLDCGAVERTQADVTDFTI
jgi:Rrf2 family protein